MCLCLLEYASSDEFNDESRDEYIKQLNAFISGSTITPATIPKVESTISPEVTSTKRSTNPLSKLFYLITLEKVIF